MPSSTIAEYVPGSKGYVRERDIRQRRYLPQLTAVAEAANAIAINIALTTFKEALNDYVTADEVITLDVELYDASMVRVAANFTLAETGDGAAVSATLKFRQLITTSAAGLAQITIDDVSNVSTATLYVKVTPVGVPGFSKYIAITFA